MNSLEKLYLRIKISSAQRAYQKYGQAGNRLAIYKRMVKLLKNIESKIEDGKSDTDLFHAAKYDVSANYQTSYLQLEELTSMLRQFHNDQPVLVSDFKTDGRIYTMPADEWYSYQGRFAYRVQVKTLSNLLEHFIYLIERLNGRNDRNEKLKFQATLDIIHRRVKAAYFQTELLIGCAVGLNGFELAEKHHGY